METQLISEKPLKAQALPTPWYFFYYFVELKDGYFRACHFGRQMMNRIMMRKLTNRPVFSILLLFATPITGMTLGVALGFFLGLNGTDAGNFIANAVYLMLVFSIIY